jgi:hypothetical protein
LEDNEYDNKYKAFVSKLKSNDINREAIINNYFELRSKIGDLKKALTQKGDENVLLGYIANNEAKIKKLKEGAGLTEAQISEYNEHNSALEKVEIEINKLRGDYQKVTTFNTETQNLLTEHIQRKNLLLSTLEDLEIKKHYTEQYAALDQVLKLFNSLSSAVELDDKRNFKQENVFKAQFLDRAIKSRDLKELLKPFVANQEIKKQIEELEKMVTEDKQKLSSIAQVKLEIKNNEDALQA